METIKQTIFSGWHLMRWVRLIFGVFFLVQAFQIHDIMIGIIAGFFLLTALANVGCCGARSCAAPVQKETKDGIEEITYEEVEVK